MDDADIKLTDRLAVARPVLDAFEQAIIVTDPDGRVQLLNRAAEDLYGWPEAEAVGRLGRELFIPATTMDEAVGISRSVSAGGAYEGDFSILCRNGNVLRVAITVQPVLDASGHVVAMVSAAEDVTDQRVLEQRVADLTSHLGLALEAGGLGTWHWNRATGMTTWDPVMEQLCGLAHGSFDGSFEAWLATIHPDDATASIEVLDAAMAEPGRYEMEHRVVWPDGTVRWLNCRGRVVVDSAGEPIGTIGCAADVTERKEAELERAEIARQVADVAARERLHRKRLEFLAEVNQAIAESDDEVDLMRRATSAAVPRLGEWSAMYVVDRSDPTLPNVEVAHVDPERVRWARELLLRFPFDPDAPDGVAHVLRSGATEYQPEVSPDDGSTDDPDLLVVLGADDIRSSIIVPMVGDGRVLGAMRFVVTGDSPAYTPNDVALAETVAGRIGAALASQRRIDQQREIARTLQASLLPASLPRIDGIDVAVRYWAAGEATEVGGDFYDVFPVGDDRWAVVIGDVCGTGAQAAAVTGLARHTIRAAGSHGLDHAQVVRWLNDAIINERTERFCTAVYATLTPQPVGFELEAVVGGHPHPLAVDADGAVRTVGTTGTLLGVFPDVRTPVHREVLGRGEFLVLYTDGITDVAPPYGLDLDELQKVVGRAASGARSADELADRLGDEISAILPIRERDDDLALVVVHITPGA